MIVDGVSEEQLSEELNERSGVLINERSEDLNGSNYESGKASSSDACSFIHKQAEPNSSCEVHSSGSPVQVDEPCEDSKDFVMIVEQIDCDQQVPQNTNNLSE